MMELDAVAAVDAYAATVTSAITSPVASV